MTFWRSSRFGTLAVDAERRAVEPHALAVAQRDRRIRKVGVRQDSVDRRRTVGQDRGARQQLLLGIGPRVGAATLDVVEVHPIDLEPGLLGNESLDDRRLDLQDLRLDIGRLGAELGGQLHHLLLHALVLADACVLVGLHARVDVGSRELLR